MLRPAIPAERSLLAYPLLEGVGRPHGDGGAAPEATRLRVCSGEWNWWNWY